MNNVRKSPYTTIAGVIGAILIVLGMVWPDKLDLETQEVIKSATNEILVGLGGLIDVIALLIAKDPKK